MSSDHGDNSPAADSEAAKAALTLERGPDNEQVQNSDLEKENVDSESQSSESPVDPQNPPLPSEEPPPPLPNEAPPADAQDDGWQPVWDDSAQAYYFHNRFSGVTQWENPRIPAATQPDAQGEADQITASKPNPRPHGGYDPAIHGDYDPTAPYAVEAREQEEAAKATAARQRATAGAAPDYTASGHFNRFTGKWQADDIRPENYNDENKSKRQMNAYFDVDAAANSHNGRSLKAERSAKKLSKQELKAFKEKRREKKEEKRRAWLRD